jgi:nitroreductase
MEFYDAINQRCSVRKFKPDPVEPEKLQRIWEAVRMAPSACNFQPWRFLRVKSPAAREQVGEVLRMPGFSPQDWSLQAPEFIVALGNRDTAWRRDNESVLAIDVAIALEHLVLAAAAEGLGACWICAFNRKALFRVLGLASPWEPVACTPLGYPDEPWRRTDRKPLGEILKEI